MVMERGAGGMLENASLLVMLDSRGGPVTLRAPRLRVHVPDALGGPPVRNGTLRRSCPMKLIRKGPVHRGTDSPAMRFRERSPAGTSRMSGTPSVSPLPGAREVAALAHAEQNSRRCGCSWTKRRTLGSPV